MPSYPEVLCPTVTAVFEVIFRDVLCRPDVFVPFYIWPAPPRTLAVSNTESIAVDRGKLLDFRTNTDKHGKTLGVKLSASLQRPLAKPRKRPLVRVISALTPNAKKHCAVVIVRGTFT